ncbi:cobalamin B12-binding domain-containing protein [Candidatus Gottesmanbacteria bacterium]|nr:cobalamin B12-binding domain-containing protein [Candidatus Gottesmanbacteria bacterium]
MINRVMLIRTFKNVGAGGPVPPLGLLYIASAIRRVYSDMIKIKLLDTGTGLSIEDIEYEIDKFSPQFIGLSALTCEADVMHKIAAVSKKINKKAIVIAGGPHPTVVFDQVLKDNNIDYAVIGEGEETMTELIESFNTGADVSKVDGIAFRQRGGVVFTNKREYIANLDSLAYPAWELVNIKDYSKYPNWNGNLKEKYYMPILTSRGCPYKCIYCHATLGKTFRARSPENVFFEMGHIYHNYGISEFHIFDDVFNLDMERSKKLCRIIINSGLKFSLSFPNGLRTDIMDEELINLLRKAGAYKINYAVETASFWIQEMIKKDFNMNAARKVIKQTVDRGIITSGYFMFGFPGETRQDIMETIEFARNSDLDLAYFFKVMPFPGTELYRKIIKERAEAANEFSDLFFYSRQRSCSELHEEELNDLIMLAQNRFYFKIKRILRLLLKSPYRLKTLRDLFAVWARILQYFCLKKMLNEVKDQNG